MLTMEKTTNYRKTGQLPMGISENKLPKVILKTKINEGNFSQQNIRLTFFENLIALQDASLTSPGFILVLQSLQMHYHPDVAKMARKINKNLPEREFDISEKLDSSYSEVSVGMATTVRCVFGVTFLINETIIYSLIIRNSKK